MGSIPGVVSSEWWLFPGHELSSGAQRLRRFRVRLSLCESSRCPPLPLPSSLWLVMPHVGSSSARFLHCERLGRLSRSQRRIAMKEHDMNRLRVGGNNVLPGLITAALGACGCTLIGFGIGAAIDKSHKRPDIVEGWRITRIEKGTRVNVFLRDGRQVQGIFNGLSFDGKEYAQRYEERQKQADGGALPPLGDTITVSRPNGKTTAGRLEGFELASITVRPEGSSPALDVPFERLSAVSLAGHEPLSGAQLQTLSGQGAQPDGRG